MRTFALAIAAVLAVGCTRTEDTKPAPAASGSAPAPAAEKNNITLKGSDTMVILGQRWAETYMKANPGVSIQVTGGGSGTGIAALINGSTDICEASRPMKDKEKEDVQAKRGAPAIETKVALDALAVYVNEKNPITEISIPALAKIYLGESKDWKDVGGKSHAIVLYGRENNSGTYGYFKEHVLSNKDFAASTQTLAGTSAVANAVKGDQFGIGYGGIAYLEGIKALKVKKEDTSPAIAPSLATAQDGSYPISRYLYFYTAGDPTGTSKKFIDWVKGAEGQKIIGDVGYYPLPGSSAGSPTVPAKVEGAPDAAK
jgi:phosphate transport system substrate-binding protein